MGVKWTEMGLYNLYQSTKLNNSEFQWIYNNYFFGGPWHCHNVKMPVFAGPCGVQKSLRHFVRCRDF